MKPELSLFCMAGVAALLGGSAAHAQDAAFGALIYKDHCAVCHGDTGGGDGKVGALFTQPPADLKLLSQGNNGVFPAERVIEAIYGRRDIQAHGQTEMPIWGDYFMTEALESRLIDPKDAAMVTQGRVLSVVSYLETLQVK
ncbi:MAG: c-type cytochrome [Tabrizicola sp.]|uniref:c-type cytochrome n=1 Tax=Tabrizicola sp. TaxID=2005166 RepID=UPI00273416E8|nr:c-type cytochrome [Tabrizicola sp.]MDP3262263.1 c-type cytochrome [Tabrizicola sp.]MDP3647990.1 c-type cytochrome [Paracoccaceae bacterium]MDZ4065415.1 c-type cytochrome [Tabrizicola sp.]